MYMCDLIASISF